MLLSSTVLALALELASVPAPAPTPAIQVERAPYARAVHAALVQRDGKEFLAVDWLSAYPPIEARRTVVVEGLDSAGNVLFTRSVAACPGMNDARFHRAFQARARVELPASVSATTLRVRAGS